MSRAYLPDTEQSLVEREIEANNVVKKLPVSSSIEPIKADMVTDEIVGHLQRFINQGWPETCVEIETDELRQYFKCRETLTTQGGLVMKGDRVIIPKKTRHYIMCQLHAGHSGEEGSQSS